MAVQTASPTHPPAANSGTAAPGSADAAHGLLQSVVLTTRILEVLAENGEMGVSEIGRVFDMPRARIHRHLKTLTATGFVDQNADSGKYRVGIKLWLTGQSVAEQFDLLAAGKKVLRRLRDQIGHTVMVSSIDADEILVLETARGTSAVEIGTKTGTRFAFNSSAQGKIALAFGPPELMGRQLARPLEATTGRACVDPEELQRQIADVRRQGWAVAPEETIIGINALAAPVFDATGGLAGTIGAVDSIQFLPEVPSGEQIDAICDAARQASAELGYVTMRRSWTR